MADRGGYRGRGREGGGRRGGRDDYGGRGRGGYEGGRGGGRGDYGGGRGDFGGRGRGDFGGRGRGDFGGRGRGDGRGRGGGRDFGRGRGGFGGGPIAPMREANEGTAARPGRRLPLMTTQQAAKDLTEMIESLDTGLVEVAAVQPKRPGFGRAGRPTQVTANHFPVKCTLQSAEHYDVEIKGFKKAGEEAGGKKGGRPEKPLPTTILRQVMQALAQQEGWRSGDWVYDGRKNIYSPRKFLPQKSSFQVAIIEEGRKRPRDFTVEITFAASVNIMALLNAVKSGSGLEIPQDAIQALDVALKHGAADNALCTSVSRNFFFEGSGSYQISGGAEVWLGYKQSLRPCENGLTLNIDVAATAFLQPVSVLQFLSNVMRRREDLLTLDDRTDLRKAQKALNGLHVNVTHANPKRKYKVKGIKAEGGAAGTFFMNEQEGREMSVAEYFQTAYKLRLRYPNHPLLNVGTPTKAVYLPVEVCKLATGQRQLKLDSKQTADMIKITAQKPEERSRRIMKALTQDSKLPTDSLVKAFGLQVSNQMSLVEGRVLQSPSLKYATEFGVPREGSWNLRDNVKFHEAASMESYAVASFVGERDVGGHGPEGFPAFMSHQVRKLRELGLRTPDPQDLPPIVYHDGRNHFPGETMEQAAKLAHQHFKQKPPRIIFVLLPDNSASNAYTDVKRASDSFLGIPSQCFAANKAKVGERDPRGREQYLANVAMKVNAKLNGTNVVFSRNPSVWMDKPYIVFGADVTHSRSFDASEPSIAAVVGSMNATCTRYSSAVRMQGHRVEMIQDLKGIVKELLKSFYQQTKRKPEKLIFYRDGVSEGQFAEVQRFEVPQIIAACRELGRSANEDYSPPLTFVVAQKRHNTRFFPTRDADRSGNVMPGLVVDSKVVHPTDFSFFLNSHAGLQGTSRPCHYHVLLDQNRFTADELQNFTNSLCYLYCRCSKSVSIVIPAYYAHLAAFRGRAMLSHTASSSDSESIMSGTSGQQTYYAEFAEIHRNLKNVMFYV